MSTKFTWKGYWQPTPIRLRKLGDALLGIFSIASVSSTITDHKNLAIVSLIIGIVGKVLSNFFAEEPTTPTPEDQTD
jgi:hypothetical protein